MKPLQRILHFAKPHQKYLYGSMIFNLLYSILNILSIGTMMPILGLMFGTVDKVDTSIKPVWNGEYSDYFDYVKDLGYYTIQVNIDNNGAIQVLAILSVFLSSFFSS